MFKLVMDTTYSRSGHGLQLHYTRFTVQVHERRGNMYEYGHNMKYECLQAAVYVVPPHPEATISPPSMQLYKVSSTLVPTSYPQPFHDDAHYLGSPSNSTSPAMDILQKHVWKGIGIWLSDVEYIGFVLCPRQNCWGCKVRIVLSVTSPFCLFLSRELYSCTHTQYTGRNILLLPPIY